jgi:hypothetical protein
LSATSHPIAVEGNSMSKRESTLTQERLKELLHYNRKTGVFTRLTDNGRGCHVGDIAGSHHRDGYIYIYVDGRNYAAHRLAWLYVRGRWPVGDLDHVHGQEVGNGIKNLREVPEQWNTQNERHPRRNNKSGFLGVYTRYDRDGYHAQLRINGKQCCLGIFDTAEEAYAAYVEAKRLYHAGCTI